MKWIQQHKIFAMAVAVAVVLSVWYIAGAVKAATRYVEQFNATYEVKEEPEGQGVNMYRVPGYHELLKEKGLLSSQVKLARTDSVGLFLNLPDSVAQLRLREWPCGASLCRKSVCRRCSAVLPRRLCMSGCPSRCSSIR